MTGAVVSVRAGVVEVDAVAVDLEASDAVDVVRHSLPRTFRVAVRAEHREIAEGRDDDATLFVERGRGDRGAVHVERNDRR